MLRILTPTGQADALHNDLRSAAETSVRGRWRGLSLIWVRGDEVIVLLFGHATAEAVQVAQDVVDRLHTLGHQAVAGVGSAGSGPAAAARSFADAVLAAQAGALVPTLGPVVPVESLGIYRLLLKLPPDEVMGQDHQPALGRLLEADPDGTLVRTLEQYLDNAGDASRTAAELHIHRSTLYYRLNRIAGLTGSDLDDGSARLELHLYLTLRRLAQAQRQAEDARRGPGQ